MCLIEKKCLSLKQTDGGWLTHVEYYHIPGNYTTDLELSSWSTIIRFKVMYLDPADSNKKIHPRKFGTIAQPPRQAQTDWQKLLEKSG